MKLILRTLYTCTASIWNKPKEFSRQNQKSSNRQNVVLDQCLRELLGNAEPQAPNLGFQQDPQGVPERLVRNVEFLVNLF